MLMNNIFKNGFIFLKCTDCRDFFRKLYGFFKKCTDLFKKMYGLYGFFFPKIVRIVRIFFRKLYGLYGFPLKMYGFFQKKFWPPCNFTLKTFVGSIKYELD